MTRKEALVRLVAGLGSWTPNEGKVAHAEALLAEIEKACPETVSDGPPQSKVTRAEARRQVDVAVAAERESIVEWIRHFLPEKAPLDRNCAIVLDEIAAAIRAGGQS